MGISVKEKEEVLVEEQTIVNLPVQYKAKFKLYFVLKRFVDILGSLFGLIILAPVFIVVAILIKREDKGPAFFTQKRIGKNGKEIKIYKFRSMVMNGEQVLEKLMAENEDIRNEYLTNKKLENEKVTYTDIKMDITKELNNFIKEETGRKPIVLPIILNIKK